jgi:NADH-quinone oxidoreductase subunit J
LVFGVLAGLVFSSRFTAPAAPKAPSATVHQLGYELMTKYVLPLEVIGLLLTVALIGAVIIAMHEK